jgi:thiol-disulfide isomerase/thioredoxin
MSPFKISPFKTLCCLCVLGTLIATTASFAEVSGQERAQQAGRAIVGTLAPRLVLKTIDGQSIDLGSLYGKKAVYLKFWATWCVPCRQQMPHFQHAYETAGPDLAVIAINVGFNDSIDAIQAFRKKLGITMPIVFDDGSLGAAFHLRVTPTHIVIGRDGRIQYVGHLADQALDSALLAARAPVAPGAPRLSGAAPAPGDAPPIAVGDLLPDRSLRTVDGQRFELHRADAKHHGDAQNKLTALVFLSPWCESYLATTRPEVSANCRNMRTQVDALSTDSRIRWLGVASGLWANTEDLRHYKKNYKVTIPLTLDASGEAFRSFRVNDVPTVVLADRQGRIVRRIEGNAAGDATALQKVIDSL